MDLYLSEHKCCLQVNKNYTFSVQKRTKIKIATAIKVERMEKYEFLLPKLFSDSGSHFCLCNYRCTYLQIIGTPEASF